MFSVIQQSLVPWIKEWMRLMRAWRAMRCDSWPPKPECIIEAEQSRQAWRGPKDCWEGRGRGRGRHDIHTPGTRYRLCKYNNSVLSFSLSIYATLSTGNCQMARCKSCREVVWHDGTSIDKKCPILFYPPSPVSDNVCELRRKGTERIDDVLAWQISSQTHLLHATQVVMLSISESFVYLPHIT